MASVIVYHKHYLYLILCDIFQKNSGAVLPASESDLTVQSSQSVWSLTAKGLSALIVAKVEATTTAAEKKNEDNNPCTVVIAASAENTV